MVVRKAKMLRNASDVRERSELQTEDLILELAQLMDPQGQFQRKKAFLAGKSVPDPCEPSDRKFRTILRWIRQELRTSLKPLWPTNRFELAVIPGRTNSGAGTRRDNDHEIGFVEIGAADPSYQRSKHESWAFAVWDVIHEFGHVLIGDPRNQRSVRLYGRQCSIKREKNAWLVGWSAVTRHFPNHFTNNDQCSYEDRKQKCIESHRRKHEAVKKARGQALGKRKRSGDVAERFKVAG